ncbi:MAG: PaaI family thioesterase [Pseudomonadota bacterium]
MAELDNAAFDVAAAQHLLADVFAPWVQDLQLSIEAIHPPGTEGGAGAVLRMKFSERLCREGGVICGQALMSLADTAMVFAVAAASGRYRPMTTVDQTSHFLKPASNADVLADARIVRMGRSMAFGQVMLTPAFDTKPVAMVSSAYALM